MEGLIQDIDEDETQGPLVQNVTDSPRKKGRRQVSEATLLRIQEFVNTPSRRQAAPQAEQTPKPLGLMGTIKEGAKGTLRALGAAADTYQGDTEDVISAAQAQTAAPKDPDLERFYAHIEEKKQTLGDNPGLWDAIKAVGGAAIDNPRGFGLMVAEQVPASGVTLGAGAAGALAGSLAGPVGTVIGGLGGLAAANIGLETGHKALEAAADGDFPSAEQSRVRGEGLVKGGVVSIVDAGTLGVTSFITRTSRRAVERATIKTLADNGVDVTSAAARRAAMETPEIAEAVKASQELAKQGATTLGKRLAQTGGAVALETIGEGAGEYLGELAATGKANAVDAVVEGFAGLGTSIGEIAATSALNRKGLQRLLDSPAEAEKTAEDQTKETGVEHEAIKHPTEPDKFVAVPKVRSVSGIELERDAEGNLKPVAPVSTQADFNLANRPGFEHTAEDKIREREIENSRSSIITPEAKPAGPIIAGRPASTMTNSALVYTVQRGGVRAQEIATNELKKRESQGVDLAVDHAPETPADTATRIIATGKERAQEDGKKAAAPIITPKAVKPTTAPKVEPVVIPKAKKKTAGAESKKKAIPDITAKREDANSPDSLMATLRRSVISRLGDDVATKIDSLANNIAKHDKKRDVDHVSYAEAAMYVSKPETINTVPLDTLLEYGKSAHLQRAINVGATDHALNDAAKEIFAEIANSTGNLLKTAARRIFNEITGNKHSLDINDLKRIKAYLVSAKENGIITDDGMVAAERKRSSADNARPSESSEKNQQVKKAQDKAPEPAAKAEPAKPETPSLRPHIADLIKRRAAASQTGKDRTVNNAIARAKEVMDGKRTDVALESKWFRAHAATMRKADPDTADILSRISEAIKAQVAPVKAKADNAVDEKAEKAKPPVAVRGDQKPVPRGGRILANGIAETIQRNGVAALVGQKITSPERLAELAQIYRNPQYETFRIFFTKGNQIVHSSGVTSRLPGSTPIFPKDMGTREGIAWIKEQMQSSGADGYWMLHNHPSGDPTPSNADVIATRQLAKDIPGMKGHVVINSNRYAQIMPSRGTIKSSVVTKHFAEDSLIKASKPSEYIGRKVPSPMDVVHIGKSFQKEGWVTLIGLSGKSGVRAIAEVPLKTFTTPGLAKAAIRRFARRTGSGNVFAYGTSADLKAGNARQLVKDGFLRDAVDESGKSTGVSGSTKSFGIVPGEGGNEARQDENQNPQTDSPAFKKWFGNSKAIDENGDPAVVYHGTGAEIDSMRGSGIDNAIFFTSDPSRASEYAETGEAPNVVPAYLSLQNPSIIDVSGLHGIDLGRKQDIEITRASLSGKDGVIFTNSADSANMSRNASASTTYVVFDPAKVKSAIGNRGTFDGSPLILNEDQALPFRDRVNKITDSLIFNFQDRFKSLKDIQKRAGPVPEDADAALAEERYSGMVRARMDAFEQQMRDPLLKAIHDSGVPFEEVEKYLHALHAPSRNAAMREINPTEQELKTQTEALEKQRDSLANDKDVKEFLKERRDLRQAEADIEDGIADESLAVAIKRDIAQLRKNQNVKDYTEALDKLKALRSIKPFDGDNTALSGMSDAEAKAILAKIAGNGTRKALERVSSLVDTITSRTRQIFVESGLEKADTIDAWNKKYEHYIPLHRDEVSGNTMPKIGQGFNIRGKESKRATGSNKEVTNILAHVVAQHEAALIRSEKSKVDRALFQFAKTHPDPSLWTLDVAPMLKTVDPTSGLVVERVDPTYKNRDEVLTLKIDGEEHTITFNDQNLEAMRLASSMKNLSAQQLGEVTQLVGKFTRFLATMNTTANPVFVARNFLRDLQTAFVNLSDTEIAAKKKEVFQKIPAAIKGMWDLSRGKPNSQWAKHAQEFKNAGGQTGWMEHYKDIGTRADSIKAELAAMQPGRANASRRVLKTWWQTVEDANNAVENGARLAAFVAARKAGISEGKAASMAKNLTVNFNAKGAKSTELNMWYMFMNASVQGTARLIKAMSNKQVRKIVAGVVLSGFLMDIMARSMAGDDDDDGENDYDQLPEHTKSMNFVFMIDGQPVTLPMPYGYNFFASAGRKISEMMFRENYSPAKSAADLTAIFLDAFSPVGQAGSGLQYVAPTVADPFIQWAENKNFAGNPLRKAQNSFGPPKPEYQMGFKSTSAPAQWLAETLNNETGGNEVRPGYVDVNPAMFDFAVSSILGGMGRTYMQSVSGPIKVAGGDDLQAREVPFLNIFVGARPEHQTERKYFEAVENVERATKEISTYRQKGDVDMVRQIREDRKGELRLAEAAKATKRILTHLRKSDHALDKTDPPNKRELRKKIEERKREVMARFNKRYREATTAD